VCFAALVTRIPALKDRFDLDEAGLALLLVIVPLVAGAGSVAAGALGARVGCSRVLRVMGPVVPLSLVVVGLSSTMTALVCSLVVVGLGLGSVDASMNTHGVAVQARYGRSLMASFFAVFSLAGIVGAGLAALAADTTLSLAAFFGLIAIVTIAVQLVVGPWLIRGSVETSRSARKATPNSSAHPRVSWRPIVLIGIALTCVYTADSAASNWGAVYLNEALGSSFSVAALGYLVYALATLLARVVIDRSVSTRGPVVLVRMGGIIAATSVVVLALAPSPAVGLIAFAALGVGIAPVIPLAFSAAASHDPDETGVAVSRVNVFNYVGFVLGAPLVGVIAEQSSLRWAFAALAPILLIAALLAPRFAVADIATPTDAQVP
jgi:MFS family permease